MNPFLFYRFPFSMADTFLKWASPGNLCICIKHTLNLQHSNPVRLEVLIFGLNSRAAMIHSNLNLIDITMQTTDLIYLDRIQTSSLSTSKFRPLRPHQ